MLSSPYTIIVYLDIIRKAFGIKEFLKYLRIFAKYEHT